MKRQLGYTLLIGVLLTLAGPRMSTAKQHVREAVPLVYTEQLILHVDKPLHLVSERIHFKIYAVATTGGEPQSNLSKVAYVELLDRTNKPVVQLKIALTGGSGWGTMDIPTHLRTDYYVLRAYTSWMKNDGPSGFFHQVLTIVNPFVPMETRQTTGGPDGISGSDAPTDDSFVIGGTADASVYGTRKKVTVRLSAHGRSETPLTTALSVSVYRMDALQEAGYGSLSQPIDLRAVPVPIRKAACYPLEREGPLVAGKIVDRVTGAPKKGVTAYLSAIGDPSVYCVATSNDDGNVVFNPPRLVGMLEGVVQLPNAGRSLQFILENPFSESYVDLSLPDLSLSPALDSLLNAYSIRLQLEEVFRLPDTAAGPAWLPFYGDADKTFRLDAYTQFATLREIFREYVVEVAPRGAGEDLTLRVLNKPEGYLFEQNPLILYDGVPVLEAAKLMEINPREIESFDVVTTRYYHGNATFDGILSFKSHLGNFHRSLFEPGALVIDVMGTQPTAEIGFPTYDGGGLHDRTPDLRSLLYWNPSVHTGAQGTASVEFFTSDVAGKYVAVIRGVDATGKPGYHTVTFEVKS